MSPLAIKNIAARSIITKSNLPVADYSANPYTGCTHACKYCYASFMKRFTRHSEPWGDFLDAKIWQEIAHLCGQRDFLGSEQPLPAARSAPQTHARPALRASGQRLSIATKSDLILRGPDLIKSFPNARVAWSINTPGESFRKDMDKAPPISAPKGNGDFSPRWGADNLLYFPDFPRHHDGRLGNH
ncbi:MAG: hypothetical protein ACTTIC_05365 [Helicobacteraceae bacterium]